MSKLLKLVKPIAVAAALFAAVGAAHAGPSYGNLATPGVYFGSGNTNGNFTIDTENGIELGLRAKNYGGAQIDGSSGVYHSKSGKSALGNRAVWSYEFSMNSGADPLSAYVFRLGVDNDPTAGTNFTYVDAANYFHDNATMSGATYHSSQNSENVIFASTPGGPFNIYSAGLYSFTLTAYAAGDTAFSNALASTEILVSVPEPETIAMMGLGLLGLALVRRRSSK